MEGAEENEENSARFQKIQSPLCKRPMCDKRKKKENKKEREKEASGRKKLSQKGYSLQNVAE